MKIEIIRDLTSDEVLQKRLELQEELFNLRLKAKTKQEQNPVRIRTLRKDLARIMTVLREEELGMGRLVDRGNVSSGKDEAKVKE